MDSTASAPSESPSVQDLAVADSVGANASTDLDNRGLLIVVANLKLLTG